MFRSEWKGYIIFEFIQRETHCVVRTRSDIDEFMYDNFVVVNGTDPLPGIGQPASKLDLFFAGCVVRLASLVTLNSKPLSSPVQLRLAFKSALLFLFIRALNARSSMCFL